MENNRKSRLRVNVSISTKGIFTWDTTAEIEGEHVTTEEVMTASDELVAAVTKKYGVPTG